MSEERIKMMRHFGAEVILTPREDGMNGAIKKAEILAAKNPNVIMLKQFENEANPEAHRLGTSMEIMEDTGGNVDVIVSAVGTSGTLTGIASTLKPAIRICMLLPWSRLPVRFCQAGRPVRIKFPV